MPDNGKKVAGLYEQLLAAEAHATAERKCELLLEVTRQVRESPDDQDDTPDGGDQDPNDPPPVPGAVGVAGRFAKPGAPRALTDQLGF